METQRGFYDYSISLSSFLALDKYPFIKSSISETQLKNNPFCIVSVLGSTQSGKTKFLSQLNNAFRSNTNQSYTYLPNQPDSLYFKSVTVKNNKDINSLFIKYPSFNSPLYNIEGISYKKLFHDRALIEKFSIGFLAKVSHTIIIMDNNCTFANDYRKYYHQILQMRHSNDVIFIIHNLSSITNQNKAYLELMKLLKSLL